MLGLELQSAFSIYEVDSIDVGANSFAATRVYTPQTPSPMDAPEESGVFSLPEDRNFRALLTPGLYFSRIAVFGDAHYVFDPLVTTSPTAFLNEKYVRETLDNTFGLFQQNLNIIVGNVLHETVQDLMNDPDFRADAKSVLNDHVCDQFWGVASAKFGIR